MAVHGGSRRLRALTVIMLCAGAWLASAAGAAEIPDNPVDEDGDGWLATSRGFRIRAAHPRVLCDPERLRMAIARMYGPEARAPYRRWFEMVKAKEDEGTPVDLVNLALLYKATGDEGYRRKYLARVPKQGVPDLTELFALDIMFDEVDEETKLRVMRRVSADPNAWYYNSVAQSRARDASWAYHSAYGVSKALAFAGVFALTDEVLSPEVTSNPEVYKFATLNYIGLVNEELSPTGVFRRIENRVAGDPTYNDALPGSFGGMYDNFGYDGSEESTSIYVIAELSTLTGEDRFTGFLHDRYRSQFYQNMHVPHRRRVGGWNSPKGEEHYGLARIWNTQTDWSTQPALDKVALTATLYRDPRMQYYVNHGVQLELTDYRKLNGLWWDLIWRDDSLPEEQPSTNPTARYFNGPGLVSMREDWTPGAAFAVFICGDKYFGGRRYEDSNSFIIHRKTDVIPHAGARIRNNPDNSRHHWYVVRSVSKNTLRIVDPDECFDKDRKNPPPGPLHSGPRLIPEDNFGGQLFTTGPSAADQPFSTRGFPSHWQDGLPYNETGTITRFEHVPDEYTYALGDATAAYTRKIEFFEREFLYLRPRTFVVFDRVKSVDPNYEKIWVMHTVDEPVVDGPVAETASGMRAYENARKATISNPANVTFIDTLLPRQNRVVVRGGDCVLVGGHALRPGAPMPGSSVKESDIPRWLELFAVGRDVEGSLTIEGDAEEGQGVTETVTFEGTRREYVRGKQTSISTTALTDETQSWQRDQWKGYLLDYDGGQAPTTITGNDEHALFGEFEGSGSWRYIIFKGLANSYKHWQRITRITTDDLDLDDLTISTPHYFDVEDANGWLHSFSPHTDSKHDHYKKRRGLGQWTFNVYADRPALLDNFLNVITLEDPGVSRPEARLLEGTGVSGVLVGSRFVVFANGRERLAEVTVEFPDAGTFDGLFLDLEPETTYHWLVEGNAVRVSVAGLGGTSARTTSAGALAVHCSVGE